MSSGTRGRQARLNQAGQAPAQAQPNTQQLLDMIRAQNAAIAASNAAMQQLQQEAQADRVRRQQERNQANAAAQQLQQQIAAAQQAGGIYGYKNGAQLTPDERQFHILIVGLGIDGPSADEVFWQGITSIEDIRTMTGDNLKNTIISISKNKSPQCPDPTKVFLGAAFERKLLVLVSWAKFQRVIGGSATALSWNSDPNARAKTEERIQYYQEIKESEGTDDISLPPLLKEMKKFRDFDDNLKAYLRIKRGAANSPLIYVIREDEAVTNIDRAGTVGKGPNDEYKNWDEYSIRCTTMNGTHWDSDNASFWQILCKLVRGGPGWAYIRKYEKKGDGDGRGAYLALYQQAYQYSSVRILKTEAKNTLRRLRFDGPARNWNWDKYVRAWLENIEVLRKYDSCPPEDDIVSDFCQGIGDPRLTQACSNILVEGSAYYNDFDKAQQYLTNCLAVAKQQADGSKKSGRQVSSTNTESNHQKTPYTGTLEAKNYPPKVWFSMTKKQKDVVRRLRKEKDERDGKNGNGKRTVSFAESEKDDDSKETPAGDQFGSAAHKPKAKKAKGLGQ